MRNSTIQSLNVKGASHALLSAMPSQTQLHHTRLNATFTGITRNCADVPVSQYRGIKYASIPRRFEAAQSVDDFRGGVVDATEFGYRLLLPRSWSWLMDEYYSPQCPQVGIDPRHLLRIPEDFEIQSEREDEFECLNLDVTCPSPRGSREKLLPVVIWIHGVYLPVNLIFLRIPCNLD